MSFPAIFQVARIQVETSHAVGFIAFARQLFQENLRKEQSTTPVKAVAKSAKLVRRLINIYRAGCCCVLRPASPPRTAARSATPAKYGTKSFLPDAPTGLHQPVSLLFHLPSGDEHALPLRQRSAAISHQLLNGA